MKVKDELQHITDALRQGKVVNVGNGGQVSPPSHGKPDGEPPYGPPADRPPHGGNPPGGGTDNRPPDKPVKPPRSFGGDF